MVGVQGILERGGEIRAKVLQDSRYASLVPEVWGNVERGATVYTDEAKAYASLGDRYNHAVISQAERYFDGQIHINGVENFWSLLKRGLGGTYVNVEPFHLSRYIDEQVCRFNNRKDMGDLERFAKALTQVAGRRLTYEHLTGKDREPDTAVLN